MRAATNPYDTAHTHAIPCEQSSQADEIIVAVQIIFWGRLGNNGRGFAAVAKYAILLLRLARANPLADTATIG